MLIKRAADIAASKITEQKTYLARRHFLAAAGSLALAPQLGEAAAQKLAVAKRSALSISEEVGAT